MENDMHPFLTHRNYQSSQKPYGQTYDMAAEAGGAFHNWIRSGYRRWQRRKMVAALEALDDRTLRDIGIHRGEIYDLVSRFDDDDLRRKPLATADHVRR